MVIIVVVVAAAGMTESGTTSHTVLSLLGGAAVIGAGAISIATAGAMGRISSLLRRMLAATA